MKQLFLAALLAGVAVTGQAAAQPSETEVEEFVSAVRSIGCEVRTDDHAAAVEEQTGFSDAKLAEIVAELLTTERAVIPSSAVGLRLTVEGCS